MWCTAAALMAACGRIGFGDHSAAGSSDGHGGGIDDSGASPDGVMPSDAITTAGLVLYFKMDDDPADSGDDSSGNGHSLVCTTNQCPTLTSGKYGAAYLFDGINDRVHVPYDATFDTAAGFTLAVWFRRTKPGRELALASKQYGTGAAEDQSWTLYMDSSGAPTFYSGNAGGNDFRQDFDIPPDDVWTHLAITWDGTTKRLYQNGMLKDQGPFAITFDVHDIYIGIQARDTQYYYPFQGSIDEVRLYDHALPLSEIQLLAQ